MGRAVVVEESQKNYFNTLTSRNVILQIGLLLGTTNVTRDLVVAMIPLFSKGNNQKAENITERSLNQRIAERKENLSGGLEYVGIYVFGTSNDLSGYSELASKSLVHLSGPLPKIDEGETESEITQERLLVQVDSRTSKASFKSYDLNSRSLRPADVKYQKALANMEVFYCNFLFNFSLAITSSRRLMKEQIDEGIQSLAQSIEQAFATVDEIPVSPSAPIPHLSDGAEYHTVDLYLPGTDAFQNNPSFSKKFKGMVEGEISFKGVVTGSAFVHSKETLGVAITALKADLVSSIQRRMGVFFAEIHQLDTQKKSNEVYDPFGSNIPLTSDQTWSLPKRVFFTLPSCTPICLSDHMPKSASLKSYEDKWRQILSLQDEDLESLFWFYEEYPEGSQVTDLSLFQNVSKRGKEEEEEEESSVSDNNNNQTKTSQTASVNAEVKYEFTVISSSEDLEEEDKNKDTKSNKTEKTKSSHNEKKQKESSDEENDDDGDDDDGEDDEKKKRELRKRPIAKTGKDREQLQGRDTANRSPSSSQPSSDVLLLYVLGVLIFLMLAVFAILLIWD